MACVALAPTPLGTLIEQHRDAILAAVARRHGRNIAVFGSVARGEETAASDIDFLVEFEPNSSLLDLIHLEDDLCGLLGVRVDIVSTGALLERDDDIRRDAIAL
jgi:predicted nucleotidyltransferase